MQFFGEIKLSILKTEIKNKQKAMYDREYCNTNSAHLIGLTSISDIINKDIQNQQTYFGQITVSTSIK